jgi:hypothetical protein
MWQTEAIGSHLSWCTKGAIILNKDGGAKASLQRS